MAKSKTKRKNNAGSTSPLKLPGKLVSPIAAFLARQLQRLEKRRSSLEGDDPFVAGRAESIAAPDMVAADQFGHARIEAVRKELDKRIIQLRKALARVKVGKYGICEDCGQMIDTDRLMIFPEATLCISCEKKREKKR